MADTADDHGFEGEPPEENPEHDGRVHRATVAGGTAIALAVFLLAGLTVIALFVVLLGWVVEVALEVWREIGTD